jgi:LacI family transcriptional regulator
VPDDISVVGFDDIPIASQLHPQLTTVRQPLQQMARAAVNLLLALVAGLDAPSEQIVLPTQLIVRESTTPLKAKKRNEGERVGVAR